jgi:hypothetical protein
MGANYALKTLLSPYYCYKFCTFLLGNDQPELKMQYRFKNIQQQ